MAVLFSYNILKFKSAMLHPDFYTYYYSFRVWFSHRVAAGEFPLWNPYWGIGHPAEVWATIPLDLFTPLEILFGPRYHVFQVLQAIGLTTAAFYAFTKLGFAPVLSASAAAFFLLTPHITFFFLYFIVAHTYIAHVLLFTFFILWFRTRDATFLFFITWTTIFSLLGTKVEFWFFQTIYFVFLAVCGAFIFSGRQPWPTIKTAGGALLAMGVGMATHLWQFNILGRQMQESGRLLDVSAGNLLEPQLYRNLLLSLPESLLMKVAVLAILLYVAIRLAYPGRVLLLLIATAAAVFFVIQERPVFVEDMSLTNGSFEEWTTTQDGRPTPAMFLFYTDGVPSGDATEIHRITAPERVKDGVASALLEPPPAGKIGLRHIVSDVEPFRGHEIRLRLWVQSKNVTSGAIQISIRDGYDPDTSVSTSPRAGWQRISLRHYVNPEAKFLSFDFSVAADATDGLLLDDIRLMRSSGFIRRFASRDGTLEGLMTTFVTGPALWGAAFGLLLSLLFTRQVEWRRQANGCLLFLVFVYYYCRQAYGDLGEVYFVQKAPWIFIFSLAAGVWLGCQQVGIRRLATLAYASILFVLVMREQGQIVLAHLAGLLWIPTRDNHIIDFAFVVLALGGLTSLERNSARGIGFIRIRGWAPGSLSMVAVVALVVTTYGNFYYVHPLVQRPPRDYPYFNGVPNVRTLFEHLRQDDTTRFYLDNEPFMDFHHGMGASLLARLPHVSNYASLNSSRYREWTTFQQLGIRPEQRWRGYPNEYSPATIARLPKTNTLGYTNSQIYTYTLINRPPMDSEILRFLGVRYVTRLYPARGPYVITESEPPLSEEQIRQLHAIKIREVLGEGANSSGKFMYLAELPPSLPRAFLIHGPGPEQLSQIQSDLDPHLVGAGLWTGRYTMNVTPATIARYDPERVVILTDSAREALLVLTDLYHQFWQVRIDGKPSQIIPAFYAFRGVVVPSGRHQVEFVCRVPFFWATVAFSLISLLASVLGFAWVRIRRRPPVIQS